MGDIKFSIDTGLVEALKSVLPLPVFVETGTFEGDAIELARPYFEEIHSIELSPEYFEHAKKRFKGMKGVNFYLGDSGKMLADLRPKFAGRSALFWLDAHWCVAQDTGGEKSQCPLLDEIRGIGPLNEDSAIMIDDARLFASPPPQPHEISQWPRLDQVVDTLRSVGGKTHELKIFNDVIVFAPLKANAALTSYMTRNTVTLLKIKDKADGYDILDAQLKEKQTEIAALKKAAVEKDTEIGQLKNAANEKDAEVASLKRETDTKDGEIAAIKQSADERKAEMEKIKAELEAECAEKDQEITGLKAEADGKDAEIASLKKISNEREQLIFTLDGHVKNFQKMVAELRSGDVAKDQKITALNSELAKTTTHIGAMAKVETELRAKLAFQEERLQSLPPDSLKWGEVILFKENHIKNIEGFLAVREKEAAALQQTITERETSLSNLIGTQAHLEISKFYGRQLAEKEAVIQDLKRACDEREALIQRLAIEATGIGPKLHKLWTGAREHFRLKIREPFGEWLFDRVVKDHWMQVGILRQYEPRPLVWDKIPKSQVAVHRLPKVAIVTPSYNQEAFVESTLLSVLNQNYPKLRYVVQDGGSTDKSPAIIAKHASKLHHWESVRDRGQGDAIVRGFSHMSDLAPDDVMAWLNSDDFINPRALHYVAEYFVKHPDVDVVYGHRIIIDENDREIGRWVLPPHDVHTLAWIDYVPQETVFWRKRIWDRAGGVDAEFQFALDWDLLLRFQTAGAKIVRLPYFLGCFRVHAHQKTSQHIHSIGSDEMTKIRNRIHPRGIDHKMIEKYARKARFWGAICSRVQALKVRI
ncbi:MAG TPA: glycosyltransferase [Opitutaceae bacterium]|nr:glycosyltransferase [Opitutaceae bacterium]